MYVFEALLAVSDIWQEVEEEVLAILEVEGSTAERHRALERSNT